MTGARMGCPLVVGLGEGENFLASDVSALIAETRRVIYLEDGDVVALHRCGVRDRRPRRPPGRARGPRLASCPPTRSTSAPTSTTCRRRSTSSRARCPTRSKPWSMAAWISTGSSARARRRRSATPTACSILASGTSYYAGLVARYWIEAHRAHARARGARPRVPLPRIDRRTRSQLVVTISQSGETLDTMEALKRAKELGHSQHAFHLQRARKRHPARVALRLLHAGRRRDRRGLHQGLHHAARGAVHARARGRQGARDASTRRREADALEQLRFVPGSIQHALNLEPQIQVWAERFAAQRARALPRPRDPLPGGARGRAQAQGDLLHPRRGVSGRRAEARPARARGRGMPVVVIAPNDALLEKVKSNMQEVRARGGELYVFADLDSHFTESEGVHVIRTPRHAGAALADRARDPGAAAGLPHRAQARHRRRQAAQPGEVRDGGVSARGLQALVTLSAGSRNTPRVSTMCRACRPMSA